MLGGTASLDRDSPIRRRHALARGTPVRRVQCRAGARYGIFWRAVTLNRSGRSFVDEIRAENAGIGLLLDLHGATRQPDAPAEIYVGTENGLTITALRQSTSDDALYRRRGLVGLLQAAGYTMLPGEFGTPEHHAFTGGYTVETYGSHHADGIDAIQLEIVAELRRTETCRARLATELANAIASLLPRWLPSPVRRQCAP